LTKKKEKEKYGTKNNEEKKVVKFCSKSIKKVNKIKRKKIRKNSRNDKRKYINEINKSYNNNKSINNLTLN